MKKKISIVLFILFLVFSFACISNAATADMNSKNNIEISVVQTEYYDWAREVLRLVNIERANYGLSALTLDYDLTIAAMQRSAELHMDKRDISHTRPNGEQCFTVSSKAFGENIAAGYRSPAEVVEGWMDSPGHRANILSTRWRSMGVGASYLSNGYYRYYWVQLFSDYSATNTNIPTGRPNNTRKIELKATSVSASVGGYKSIEMEVSDEEEIVTNVTTAYGDYTINKSTAKYVSGNTNIVEVSNGIIRGKSVGETTVTITVSGITDTIRVKVTPQEPKIAYRTHVQSQGWQRFVKNGQMSGTSKQSLRLEAIEIKLDNYPYSGSVEYKTHVESIGWQDWVKDGQMSGTSGRSLRLEAIAIRLTGQMAEKYDIYYRVHAQTFGWMGWAKNGEQAGSAGYSYRLEAIEIKLVEKGEPAPGSTKYCFKQNVKYQTHVQSVGWQNYVSQGETAGTSGRALRLEAIRIKLDGVQYRTHVQSIGWQNWVGSNELSGTSGRGLRLEAISIRLTGAPAEKFDIYYRVHAQTFGWMGWAKNGEDAGTAGYSYRLEAIQIVLVEKGDPAPGSTDRHFVQQVRDNYLLNRSSKKIHKMDCGVGNSANAANKVVVYDYLTNLINSGYTICGDCKPQ